VHIHIGAKSALSELSFNLFGHKNQSIFACAIYLGVMPNEGLQWRVARIAFRRSLHDTAENKQNSRRRGERPTC
jgi:hypothetical protein